MNKLLCVSGMPGSGKTILSSRFTQKGFQFIRFGQVVLDEIIKKGLEPNEKNQKLVREEIRKKYGKEAIAKLLYPQIKKLLNQGNVVADGLYSWSEYKYLKEKFGDKMIVIAVFSPPKLRHLRLSNRHPDKNDTKLKNHHFTLEEAKKRDYNEIENVEKGGPIAMADHTLLNVGTLAEYESQIEEMLKQFSN